jgi:hypothetical protein
LIQTKGLEPLTRVLASKYFLYYEHSLRSNKKITTQISMFRELFYPKREFSMEHGTGLSNGMSMHQSNVVPPCSPCCDGDWCPGLDGLVECSNDPKNQLGQSNM